MPPKSRRKLQLDAARARKGAKLDDSSGKRNEGSCETTSERREEAGHNSVVERGESSVRDEPWNEMKALEVRGGITL